MSASSFHLPGASPPPDHPDPQWPEKKLRLCLALVRDCSQRASDQLDMADPRYTDWVYVLHQLVQAQEQLSAGIIVALEKARGTNADLLGVVTLAETDHRLDALPNTFGTETNGGES